MNWKILLIATSSLILASQGRADRPDQDQSTNTTGCKRDHLLIKFDANGDGKLDSTERAAMKQAREKRHAELLKKFDANSDGKLDDTEKAAMKQEHEARWIERHPKLVKKFDANSDGKLDDTERVALRKFRDERRAGRQKQQA